MLFGVLPFDGTDEEKCEEAVKNTEPVYDFQDNPVSEDVKNLLKAAFSKDPDNRPSISQLIADHHWLTPP